MKINGIDIRKYDAKQLTADVQPPSFSNSYEWLTGAALPTEFETEVQMGHLKLSIYFKGKNRNNIIRAASEFMMNFTKACKLELDGYKGTYIGFITSNDYEKKNVKERYVVNIEFDGFFVDDDLSIVFDGKQCHYLDVLSCVSRMCVRLLCNIEVLRVCINRHFRHCELFVADDDFSIHGLSSCYIPCYAAASSFSCTFENQFLIASAAFVFSFTRFDSSTEISYALSRFLS